jgi:hypothetical protein
VRQDPGFAPEQPGCQYHIAYGKALVYSSPEAEGYQQCGPVGGNQRRGRFRSATDTHP